MRHHIQKCNVQRGNIRNPVVGSEFFSWPLEASEIAEEIHHHNSWFCSTPSFWWQLVPNCSTRGLGSAAMPSAGTAQSQGLCGVWGAQWPCDEHWKRDDPHDQSYPTWDMTFTLWFHGVGQEFGSTGFTQILTGFGGNCPTPLRRFIRRTWTQLPVGHGSQIFGVPYRGHWRKWSEARMSQIPNCFICFYHQTKMDTANSRENMELDSAPKHQHHAVAFQELFELKAKGKLPGSSGQDGTQLQGVFFCWVVWHLMLKSNEPPICWWFIVYKCLYHPFMVIWCNLGMVY